MAFVMQVLGTRASRFMITMGKRNLSMHSDAPFTPNGPVLAVVAQARSIDWSGVIRKASSCFHWPNKAAVARLTTVALLRAKELMWVVG